MPAQFKLGIQSYTFRTFKSIPSLVDALTQCGLSYVEVWPGHLSHDAEQGEKDAAFELCAQKGITVDSYGQAVFKGDTTHDRGALAFAKYAGIKAITADVDPQVYESTERLCNEFDVNLAIHNHGRNHRYGHIAQIKDVFARTGPRFGLCLDTGWLIDAGEDPIEALDLFADRIYGVHLKDFTYNEQNEREDVIIGTGGLDLPGFMRKLDSLEFNGYLSIEYEGDADDPIPNMHKCVEAAQEAIDAL